MEELDRMRPVWAEIDLDRLKGNIQAIRKRVDRDTLIFAVVKADGYGHGALEIVPVLLENGADRLAVAMVDEGIELRRAGINVPILLLGATPPEQAKLVVEYDLTPTVFDLSLARSLSNAAKEKGKTARIHLKVDTGMGRVGVLTNEFVSFLDEILKLQAIEIEGLFTHFAAADTVDKTYTHKQIAKFESFAQILSAKGIDVPIIHAANSAGTLTYGKAHFSAIRPGIILYGLAPSDEMEMDMDFKQVMQLKAKIVNLKELPAGSSVSYGCTYTTDKLTRIATIPLGYGDGFSRLFSSNGEILVCGKKAPIIGRVCMDQFMVDVTHIPEAKLWDEVVIFGEQGNEKISTDEVAARIGTINYEIVCILSRRVPRVYTEKGIVVKVKTFLDK